MADSERKRNEAVMAPHSAAGNPGDIRCFGGDDRERVASHVVIDGGHYFTPATDQFIPTVRTTDHKFAKTDVQLLTQWWNVFRRKLRIYLF